MDTVREWGVGDSVRADRERGELNTHTLGGKGGGVGDNERVWSWKHSESVELRVCGVGDIVRVWSWRHSERVWSWRHNERVWSWRQRA